MWWRILIYGIIISGVISIIAWYVGAMFAEQYKQYKKDYELLVMAVRYGLLDPITHKNIKKMFKDIRRYDYAKEEDKFLIDELEIEFNSRYDPIITSKKISAN